MADRGSSRLDGGEFYARAKALDALLLFKGEAFSHAYLERAAP